MIGMYIILVQVKSIICLKNNVFILYSLSIRSALISMFIVRYREKALLPSLCPLRLPTRLGSCTLLYRFPIKVLRAKWEEATSAMLFCSTSPVVGLMTETSLVMPQARKTSLMYSL